MPVIKTNGGYIVSFPSTSTKVGYRTTRIPNVVFQELELYILKQPTSSGDDAAEPNFVQKKGQWIWDTPSGRRAVITRVGEGRRQLAGKWDGEEGWITSFGKEYEFDEIVDLFRQESALNGD